MGRRSYDNRDQPHPTSGVLLNTAGCMLGAAAGDLAGINSLFEPTFGCDPTLPASECAFNPAAGAPDWPQCQSDPNIAHCPPIAPSDNFDISAVDGYTMPQHTGRSGL